MKQLIAVFLVLVGAVSAWANPPAPYPLTVDSRSSISPGSLVVQQANSRTFRVSFLDGTNVPDMSSTTPFMSWSPSSFATNRVTSSWSFVSGSTNAVDFTFSSASLNTNGGPFIYEVGASDSNGALFVYAQGPFTIRASPASTGAGTISFGTNINWGSIDWIGLPTFIYHGEIAAAGSNSFNVITNHAFVTWNTNQGAGGSAGGSTSTLYSISGTGRVSVATNNGPTARVDVNFNGFATGTPIYVEAHTGDVGSLDGVATGSPVYVETDAAAIAQLSVASNALRLSAGLLTTQLVANGLGDTNALALQGGIRTNLDGFTAAYTSAVVAQGLINTNTTGLVNSNFVAQGLIQSNLILNGLGDTNNLIADGLLSTNHVRTGLIFSNFVGLVSTQMNTQGSQITNNLAAQGLINTQLIANGLADTNEVIARGLLTTQFVFNGLGDTNLSGRVTTNYVELGLARTNITQIGQQITNNLIAQGLIATQQVAAGLYATNLSGRVDTNLIAQGLLSTQLVANGLGDTNLSGRVTTNYTELGLVKTNLIQNGLAITNNRAMFDAASNQVAILNTQAVLRSGSGQTMYVDLQSYGTIQANTNLVAADTNSVSTERLSNGTFTGNAVGWALVNASYNANNVLVLPSASATVTYTSTAAVVVGKVYLLSWDNTLAYGQNFTTFKVASGGKTNNVATAPTGTIAYLFKAQTTQNPQFIVDPGTNQWIVDTVSLKEITDGDLIVADDAAIGGRLFVGEGIETTGTISGNVTGYLPLVGGTMTGPVTNLFGVYEATLTVTQQINMGRGGISFLATNSGAERITIHPFTVGSRNGLRLTNSVGAATYFFADVFSISDTIAVANGQYDSDGGLYELNGETAIASYNTNGTYKYAGGSYTVSNGTMHGNGAGFTNLPAAATTAGVNQISATGAVSGNITFSGSGVQQTNTTFYFPLVAAVQTGQVDSISNTGAVRGAIVITGSAVTQTGNTFNISATGGGATGTPVQVIDAGANITVTRTGDTVNIVGSAGGSGATQAISTVGSSTVTSTISGATLSWSNAASTVAGSHVDVNGSITTTNATLANVVGTDVNAVVMGGVSNTALAPHSIIGGGRENLIDITATNGTIGGGWMNKLTNGSYDAVIAGGYSNTIDGATNGVISGGTRNRVTANWGSIAGGHGGLVSAVCGSIGGGGSSVQGEGNTVSGTSAHVGGGAKNIASGVQSIIGAGDANKAPGMGAGILAGNANTNAATYATIGGGAGNYIASGSGASFIGGGYYNTILDGVLSSDSSFIGGGETNVASDTWQTIGGGRGNTIGVGSYWSTIGGGDVNRIGANAQYATIPGGKANQISADATNAFAAGNRAIAAHPGAFVWSDAQASDFTSTAANQFNVRASGGANFGTNSPWTSGATQAQVTVSGYLYADHIVTSTGSIQIGQTSLQETQLKSLYTSRKLTWAVVWLSLLLVGNFIRDRVRERENKRRDTENSRRIRALERQLGIGD